MSYECTQNTLGARAPPRKKVRVRNKSKNSQSSNLDTSYFDSDSETEAKEPRGSTAAVEDDDNENSDHLETLSAAIQEEVSFVIFNFLLWFLYNNCNFYTDCIFCKFLQHEKNDLENYRLKVATGQYEENEKMQSQRKRFKKSSYFSDEEDLSDWRVESSNNTQLL